MITFEVTDAVKNKSRRSPHRSDFIAIMSGVTAKMQTIVFYRRAAR